MLQVLSRNSKKKREEGSWEAKKIEERRKMKTVEK